MISETEHENTFLNLNKTFHDRVEMNRGVFSGAPDEPEEFHK